MFVLEETFDWFVCGQQATAESFQSFEPICHVLLHTLRASLLASAHFDSSPESDADMLKEEEGKKVCFTFLSLLLTQQCTSWNVRQLHWSY